jgi:predicted amidophosphoribosyltransferase
MEETPTEDEGQKSDDDEEKKEENEKKKEEEGDEIPELTPVAAQDTEDEAEAPKQEAPAEEEKKEEETPSEVEVPIGEPAEEEETTEAPAEEPPKEDGEEYKMPKPDEVGEAEKEEGDDYKMPTLDEVEAKEEAAPSEEETPEEEGGDPIDLDAADIEEHTKCPKCEMDYVAKEKFCTNCGAPVQKTQESVQSKEEIITIKVEADGNVYKAPALEWHDDEPRRFEVGCYNCQTVFEASVKSVPTIISCPQCQTQLQIEEMPPEEEDEEDMEITAKEPSMQKVKPPKKGCPACGGKTRFIPRHFKWFCDTCRRWI